MNTSSINAQSIFDENTASLKLNWICGRKGRQREFSPEIIINATSGADLIGHLNPIHPKRIQVLGQAELSYYQRLTQDARNHYIAEIIEFKPPFLVIAGISHKDQVPPEIISHCTRSSTPLFITPLSSAAIIDNLRLYMSRILAPRVTMHGVFLDILGMGVLLTGDSGLGKSELGLELISRGHGLVADDAVDLARLGLDYIDGQCPPLLQNLLEVRGLGLLDIKTIFGENAVRRKKELKLIVNLVRQYDCHFERLQFEQQTFQVLDLPIKIVTLQVAAGRNLAVLVEAAVRNTILQFRGIDTLKDFTNRQKSAMHIADHSLAL